MNPLLPKIEVKVQGCGANQGEAAALSGQLRQMGLDIALEGEKSQVLMLHACTVKGDEDPLNETLAALRADPDKKVVVSGCVTPELKLRLEALGEQVIVGKDWDDSAKWASQSFGLSPLPAGPRALDTNDKLGRIGTVTISSGCLDRCAFCSTVRVKGKLQSLPPEQIIAEVSKLVESGAQEIRLAGQDTACYGFDLGSNLVELVQKLVAIPGDFKLRLGMGNPRHLKGFEEAMAELLHHPKVYQFLHLPVQAGSDRTLEAMKRGHRNSDFLELWEKLILMVPELVLSTDLIVGHPGEEDEDFAQTLELVKLIKPYFCNITRFVPRAKTLAATLKAPSGAKSKERSRALTELYRNMVGDLHQAWVGKIVEAYALEEGPKVGQWTGRTQNYLKIVGEGPLPGPGSHKILVTKHTNFGLFGEIQA